MNDAVLTLLQRLPLPLAQLVRRSVNAKSAVERHHCAFYLGEATLKLIASARIALYLEHGLEPGSDISKRLESITLPSFGQWCGFLRTVNDALAELPDAALLPLARVASGLDQKHPQWTAVATFAEAVVQADVVPRELARKASAGTVNGFFQLLGTYRNEVIGHGAQRSNAFCDGMGAMLLDALVEVLRSEELLDGLVLSRPVSELGDDGEPRTVWQRLEGLGGMATNEAAHGAEPGQVHLTTAGFQLSLHPFLVVREDDLGREQVGFLNKTILRTRKVKDGPTDEVRRVDYLDYASGEPLAGIDARSGIQALLSRLRGTTVGVDDIKAAEEATIAGGGMGEETAPDAAVASAMVGDFELLGELGRGGMGIVYKARQLSTGRIVALKVLPPMLAADSVSLKRFKREVAALARCDHPNVIKVLTAGSDGDRHYYAMEYVDGADLARVFRPLSSWSSTQPELREGHLARAVSTASSAEAPSDGDRDSLAPPLPPTPAPQLSEGRSIYYRLAELFADVAAGLEHLHQAGITHRDIKPGNLMLTADAGRVVIMDLGLARTQGQSQVTGSAVKFVGTLRYMPPEQLQRQLVDTDHRADIYGLGATLYELATGQPFFDGDNEKRLIQQILHEEPVPAIRRAPRMPRDLATVIHVATQKAPEHRYRTARSMAEDLRAVAERRPIQVRAPGLAHRARLWALRNRAVALAFAALPVAVAVSGALYWNHARTRIAYYEQCVDRLGVWEGVQPIDAPRGHDLSCRVTSRRGRIVQSAWVNAAGVPVAVGMGDAWYEYSYADDGKVIERVHVAPNGRIRQRHRMDWDGRTLQATVTDRNRLRTSLDDSDVAMYRMEYDEHGFEARQFYFNDRGSPRPNADTSFGYAFEVDANGLLRVQSTLSPDGGPSMTQHGVARVETRRDDRGRPIETRTLGVDGKLTPGTDGVALIRRSFDARGNLVQEQFFDSSEAPAPSREGYASAKMAYDERGQLIETSYFGTDGRPGFSTDGVSIHRMKRDDRGQLVEEAFFGVDGRPTNDAKGVAGWREKYDPHGNPTESACFGVDGAPRVNTDGRAVLRSSYDERGNRTEVAFFDTHDRPALDKDGVAGLRSRFDARDNEIEVAYFGVDGKPTQRKGGAATIRRRFDERGNVVEEAYLDQNGRPMPDKQGIAVLRNRYDDRGAKVESSYWGVDGQATLDGTGAARLTFAYDDLGNLVERSSFGTDGQPTTNRDGYATWRGRYDERGNRVESAYFGVRGEPAVHKDVQARTKTTYDERGHATSTAYFGVDGKPASCKDGFAVASMAYDAQGRQVSVSFFGPDGTPVVDAARGAARIRMGYDERGNQTEVTFLGLDGQPAPSKHGIVSWKVTYDERGRVVEKVYFDAAGNLAMTKYGYARRVWENDERGNPTLVVDFDAQGRPYATERGYSRVRAKYDERGNRIEEAYFLDETTPALARELGAAGSRRKYDALGREVEREYFGLDGRPAPDKSGHVVKRLEYDTQGQVARETFLDAQGHVVEEVLHDRAVAERASVAATLLRSRAPELFHGSIGLVVMGVEKSGAGAKAGIRPGDLLVLFDGKQLQDQLDMSVHLRRERTKPVPIVLVRGAADLTVQVDPGELGLRFLD